MHNAARGPFLAFLAMAARHALIRVNARAMDQAMPGGFEAGQSAWVVAFPFARGQSHLHFIGMDRPEWGKA